ncbi:MAG: outer membrane beta-barrel domain-containing protein [Deltaproteobacteria bacterium]|nr:outer membrane beta-barrel domain-containing protein [Deltaproteobacteria bacterium]
MIQCRLWLAFTIAIAGQVASPAFAQDMQFTLEETEQNRATSGEQAPSSSSPQRTTEAREEIYAVQQIYALRINRVELMPSIAISLNDPFVSHTGIGLAFNFWWTNVLAIGLNAIWYEGLETESDLSFQVRRSTRLSIPITQSQFGAYLNFTYVPIYGKFAMFNQFIFQYDAYVVGGVGVMRTRPIPVIDPDVRKFDYEFRVAFNLGLGLRVFITRWLAAFAELRNYMYLEQLENLNVALGEERTNPSTWVQPSLSFINNVTAHVGITLFLPPEFQYRLPR